MKSFFGFLLGLVVTGVIIPQLAVAQISADLYNDQLHAGASKAGLANEDGSGDVDPRILISQLTRVALSIFGTFFVGLIVLAGYRLIKADGDSTKIQQAYDTLRMSIIGLIIILAAFSISNFLINKITSALKDSGPKSSYDQ